MPFILAHMLEKDAEMSCLYKCLPFIQRIYLGRLLLNTQGLGRELDQEVVHSAINHGNHKGGPLSFSKIFKTPFFKRYLKFLPSGDSYSSKTSPIFFFLKYLNKYSRQRRPKFWPKWAVAGRLVDFWPKFFCQICTDM